MIDAWEVLEVIRVLDARPWLEVTRERVRLPDGHIIDDFYQVDVPEHAIVLAFTPDGEVLVQEQYKHGHRGVCLGFPAGFIDEGETPLESAKRELLEETGFTAEGWENLGAYTVDGNKGFGRAHLFAARNAEQVAEPTLEPAEAIEVSAMKPREIDHALVSGRIQVLSHAFAAMWIPRLEREPPIGQPRTNA
ncbi:MAG: NUDIX hydrolase [Candidatus Thermoplasmatota archaeon]|nr:NUDIX hydrolase [Candidatus Thermoplasmatota archaeon]